MASRKNEPGLAEAAEKTRDVIRGLQSRLPEPPGETAEDLEHQLEQYFERTRGDLDEIRKRVVDGVVERMLHRWEQTGLQEEVVERLVERILARLSEPRS